MSELKEFSLGVDTGGTFTDAVLVDRVGRQIVSAAKAITTKHELFVGISSAIKSCIEGMPEEFSPEQVTMVCLSTTLATNAITEGYGGSVCEILIGYNRHLFQKQGFLEEMVSDDLVWLAGGHDLQGDEVAALDEKIAEREILKRSDKVDAFAVSGYFGTRNPDHELRVKSMVEQLTDLPVTCAHELTSRLNSVNRAVTVGHNARLIPLIKELLSDIGRSLELLNISAPLMVVKGDGAIVPAHLAVQRPIETILSGPAASCVGASHLTGQKNVWVADMGGTTTDIALLKNGYPTINSEGAYISHRRSMVEAADVHTIGIGGDSTVDIGREGEILIGPRRATPLCLLAEEYPAVVPVLKSQVSEEKWEKYSDQFVMAWRPLNGHLGEADQSLLNRLKNKPSAFLSLIQDRKKFVTQRRIEQLERKCLVHRSGFTPTDALHVLGKLTLWNREASVLGATLLSNRLGVSVTVFCESLLNTLKGRLIKEMISKAVEPAMGLPGWDKEPFASGMIDMALNHSEDQELACRFTLKRKLVAIGAPVDAYMPPVAEGLGTELILPEYAHVANAFGAATAGFIQRSQAVIRMMEGGLLFRAHLPGGIKDFSSLEEAKKYTENYLKSHVTDLARKMGVSNIKADVSCNDHSGKLPAGSNQEIFLDIEFYATAYSEPEV